MIEYLPKIKEILSFDWQSLGLLAMAFTVEQRRLAFKRANGRCEDCGKKFTDGWLLHVNHIKPIHDGGKDELSNSSVLCCHCHANHHLRLYQLNGKQADYSAYLGLINLDPRTRKYRARNLSKKK